MPFTLEQVEAAGGYTVILADPCWSYRDGKNPNSGADRQYATMSTQELCALPVERLAAPDCALFLWCCSPMWLDAYAVGKAWGFKYKTKAFDWIKMAGQAPFMGLGHWTRSSSEDCLLFVRGKPARADAGVRQAIETFEGDTLESLKGRHSAKPPEVRKRIEQLMGDVPRIELFARDRVAGWDAWGNEVEGGPDVVF